MQRLRDYIRLRRIRRYQNALERYYGLRVALAGIDYSLHPDVYDEIEADLNRVETRCNVLAEKLGD